MAREHVEFLQSQQLPWATCPWPHPGAGSEIKLLSLDPETGACSYLARLPSGWRSTLSALAVSEELFKSSTDPMAAGTATSASSARSATCWKTTGARTSSRWIELRPRRR